MRKTSILIVLMLIPVLVPAQTEPVIRDGEKFTYVAMEFRAPYAQFMDKFTLFMQELAKQKVDMAGTPMGVFPEQSAPGEAEPLWAVAAPVEGKPDVKAPLLLREFAYAQQAEVTVKGPYGDMSAAIQGLMTFIGQSGYRPCGPVFETYMDDPTAVRPEDCRTLIVVPVEKL